MQHLDLNIYEYDPLCIRHGVEVSQCEECLEIRKADQDDQEVLEDEEEGTVPFNDCGERRQAATRKAG